MKKPGGELKKPGLKGDWRAGRGSVFLAGVKRFAVPRPGSRRAMVIGCTTLIAATLATGIIIARRTRREIRSEELEILQGVRKVCKLSTLEMSLADYAKKTVPKTIDLPFTKEPTAYLFYSGIVSAGFDVCDGAATIDVNHAKREVRMVLPPARILSVDVVRFETINEDSGFLNEIAPADRNRWFAEARVALEQGARRGGALAQATTHARELFAGFVGSHGYSLTFTVADGER